MTGMTPERLAEIREHFTGWISVDDINNVRYAQDLIAHIDHLTAENARQRELGARFIASRIARCSYNLYAKGDRDGSALVDDYLRDALHELNEFNPPTEGETDE